MRKHVEWDDFAAALLIATKNNHYAVDVPEEQLYLSSVWLCDTCMCVSHHTSEMPRLCDRKCIISF